MSNQPEVVCHWFRRDLRLDDNAALYYALRNHANVLPVFLFDKEILSRLDDQTDKRVLFIYRQLQQLQQQLALMGSSLFVIHDSPLNAWKRLTDTFKITHVYTNHDYEPYARKRDSQIADFFKAKGIAFSTFKDQVIFEKNEVLKDDDSPYTVFTPYSKRWKQRLNGFYLKSYPTEKYFGSFYKGLFNLLPLQQIGFQETDFNFPKPVLVSETVKHYAQMRNIPSIQGTTRLSIHLRFGTLSIRKLASQALQLSDIWLNELIWREFFMMILWHFPKVEQSFKRKYDQIKWRNNEVEFDAWCKGITGYPIVDAGMRELNATGFMHNRVRMITASFLTKHLLIDWRWGEAYFAKKLLDFELSSNNGGWQWAAGSGCDAAPYFRIFNPEEQTKKFDPDLKYIKTWVPEWNELTYPQPIVEHKYARLRCLDTFKSALEQK
jgi:deoxyribodipyrimidine photo-lyase